MPENEISSISPDAPYVVIDRQTGEVVYKTTYKNRRRARNFADKKDNEYGGYRYYTKLLEETPKQENKNDSIKGENNMLVQLYKLAYDLDRKGLHSEAEEIEEVMKLMAKRVGLNVEDMVSLANYFDEVGDSDLADKFDGMAKEAAGKDKEKMLKLKEKLKKAKEKEKAEKEKAKAKKLKEKEKQMAKKEKEKAKEEK